MKYLSLIFIFLLSGCAADITLTMGANMDCPETKLEFESARRTAISVNCGTATIITGQVTINDETVQVLGKGAIDVTSDIFEAGYEQGRIDQTQQFNGDRE